MRSILLILLLLLSACGRTAVGAQDSGPAADSQPADRARLDRGSPPPGCAALASFAKGRPISSRYARKVRFSPSLKRLAVVTHRDNAHGDLYLFTLPALGARIVAPRVTDAQWLPDESGLIVSMALQAGKSTPYMPLKFDASGNSGKVLAQKACHHLVTPDGRRAYVVGDCDKDHRGRLTEWDLASSTGKTVSTNVAAFSLAVSPDSKLMAYVENPSIPTGCYNATGAAVVRDAAGKERTVAKDVMYASLQFTSAGLLMARRLLCTKPQQVTFLVADAATGALKLSLKESQHDFYGYGFMGRRYSVSPDGKQLLFAPYKAGLNSSTLAVRSLTTGAARPLVSDLFPFHMTSMAFHAWSFADRGRHVAYVRAGPYPNMALAAVPQSGGKKQLHTSRLYGAAYVASRDSDHLAWIEATPAGEVMEVNLGSVRSANRVQVMVSHKQPLSSLSLLPGGRGVLVVQRAGKVQKLHLGSGGGTQVLGQWSTGYLTSSFPAHGPPVAGYHVDPLGCAVVYNQDLPGVARGAYMRQIFTTP